MVAYVCIFHLFFGCKFWHSMTLLHNTKRTYSAIRPIGPHFKRSERPGPLGFKGIPFLLLLPIPFINFQFGFQFWSHSNLSISISDLMAKSSTPSAHEREQVFLQSPTLKSRQIRAGFFFYVIGFRVFRILIFDCVCRLLEWWRRRWNIE